MTEIAFVQQLPPVAFLPHVPQAEPGSLYVAVAACHAGIDAPSHAIEFEYPNNVYATSMCRQIDGCANRVAEAIHGTKGWASTGWGGASIKGDNPWKFEKEKKVNPYVQEHVDLVASIGGGEHLNEARRIAESTLCAIMGRMSAYTGKAITWEEAMNSKLDLTPDAYKFGDMEIPPVAVPGKTPLI